MVRLVFSIIFLIILAVFITFNAQYTTGINLFGYKMESVPVVAVVLLTLVAGVIYSFGLYLITYFSKRRVDKQKKRKRKNEAREKELKEQERELKSARDSLKNPQHELPPPDVPTKTVTETTTPDRAKKKRGKSILRPGRT